MLNNFEEQTHELSKDEKRIMDTIKRGLEKRRGKHNAMTSTYICRKIKEYFDYDLKPVRLRKIINYMRTKNKIVWLCACSKGYYIARDKPEYLVWLHSLDQRIKSMQEVYKAGLTQIANYTPSEKTH